MTRPAPVTVRLKPCRCGVLEAEPCDCAERQLELEELLANPIHITREKAPEAVSADGLPPGDERYQ